MLLSADHSLLKPVIAHAGARVIAVLLLWAVAAVAFAQTTVEVIALKYRQAEQLIPVIQPLLGRESSISSFQNQLVIRATAVELAQVRRVLASLDTAPRRLLITVRQDADFERDRRDAELSASVGNGEARVTVPGSSVRESGQGGQVVLRDGDDRLRARVIDSQQMTRDRTTQTVQVLEGSSAFIRIGESRPVPDRQVVRSFINGRVVERVTGGTEYREANTGFHVLPRVQGDRVTLDISPQRESFDDESRRGTVNTQRLATTVSGRLGEWMDLGGIGDARSDDRSVLLGRSTGRVNDRRGVQVKVEELR